jgi:H+-translocating NAD(P) transhydrogenase subunit beta
MTALATPLGSFASQMLYLAAASLFIVGLKLMSHPRSAQKGNLLGALGMALAGLVTFVQPQVWDHVGIVAAVAVGALVGVVAARTVKMTGMPQLVALFNGVGGAASVFVAGAEFQHYVADTQALAPQIFVVTGGLSVLIGSVTLTGSVMAFAKLQELMRGQAITYPGQKLVSGLVFIGIIVCFVLMLQRREDPTIFWAMAAAAGVLGIMLVIPIGGADMPVVISLLNSYSGLAACAAGFVVGSKVLIVSGALVGAAGVILTRLMCKAMNRSIVHVIFGAFGASTSGGAKGDEKPMKEFSPTDAAMLLTNANQVVIVPGYGLAVSQAQQNVRELADMLEAQGVTVKYGIHPVAGRMPGHMNVLLAEANVPYEQLFDLEEINGEFENTDVAVIIGANDVVNPSAREDKTSPLFGMPILNVDKAQTVIVLKRGRGQGFAGVENPLFTADNTGLVFGDAKKTLVSIVNEVKAL